MTALRRLSIQHKLRPIIMATVGAALLLACAAALIYDYVPLRESMCDELTFLAEILGSHGAAALSAGQQKAAEEILAGLKTKRHIIGACIYSSDGKVFAIYRRAPDSKEFAAGPVEADGKWFRSGRLVVFRRILLRNQRIGEPVGGDSSSRRTGIIVEDKEENNVMLACWRSESRSRTAAIPG